MQRFTLLVGVVSALLAAPTALQSADDAAQPGRPQGTVAIDDSAPAVRYSRLLFGGFLEHFANQVYGGVFDPGSALADDKGFRRDVIAALRELKLSVVRWPGGCFASGYHWRDGVGKARRPVLDVVWGVEDPNTFGTDEFVEWCRRVGCEPYLCTNAGNGTAQEMRDWVEYCNATGGELARLRAESGHARPWGVRYWSIGNENWGSHEIGARTPQDWGPLVLRSAQLMRSADSGLTLLAAATPQRHWTMPLLKAAGPELQAVAVHQYWLPCWGDNLTPDYLTCIAHAESPQQTIAQVVALLDEAGYRRRVKIALDEWNLRGWHHPGFPRKEPGDPRDAAVAALVAARRKNDIASQYTMADALFSASFLNACLRHADDVLMANIAPIVNTRGPLYVHPRGVVRRTTFHVLAMYANLLGENVAPTKTTSTPLGRGERSVPTLDAVATCGAGGRSWRIALVNRHPSERLDCLVSVGDKPLAGTFRATVLEGDSPDAYNDVDHPDRVAPRVDRLVLVQGRAALPPHSLTILEVDAAE